MTSFFNMELPSQAARAKSLPARAGVGLKPVHFQEISQTQPDIGFFEVHAENYMVPGGPYHHYLSRIRGHYPLSIHGVGLSIGADAALDIDHLDALAMLLARYQPQSFSEHLAWSTHGPAFLNDLLPLPYNTVCLHAGLDGPCPVATLLERDNEVPAWPVLLAEANLADQQLLALSADEVAA